MSSLPSIFLSHGSPMLALQDSPARRFLQTLGASLARPEAILFVSAHWETRGGPAVSLAQRPETIHDFGGFPRALFEMRYPAPGAPGLPGAPPRCSKPGTSGSAAARSVDSTTAHGCR